MHYRFQGFTSRGNIKKINLRRTGGEGRIIDEAHTYEDWY